MNTKIKIPRTLTRAGFIEETTEGEKAAKRISISSDTPYLRYDWMNGEEYYEVLSHKEGDIDDARLREGLPVLFNHNRNEHLGRATKYNNNGRKIDVGTVDDVIWSQGESAQSRKRDIENGSLVGTSVGYQIVGDGRRIGEKDGIPILEFRWSPHEFSFCTIEADITCGAGRERSTKAANGEEIEFKEIVVNLQKSLDSQSQICKKTATPSKNMPEAAETQTTEKETTIDVVKERQSARDAYKKAAKEINDYVTQGIAACPDWEKALRQVAQKHLDGDADFQAFQAEAVLTFPGAKKLTEGDSRANLGMSKGDIKRFSFCRAIVAASTGNWKGAEFEAEVIEATQRQYGAGKDARRFDGFAVPDDIKAASFAEVHDLSKDQVRDAAEVAQRMAALQGRTLNATTFTQGGALVAVDLLGGSFIDILRNAVLIGQGPLACTELNGLVGNIAIPKQTGTSTVYWGTETATISESTQALAQLNMSPKRMSAITSYSKELLTQSSISVEMFVRSDIALTMAVEEDRVSFYGAGVNGEPLGIFNTSGVLANVTFSGNASWAKLVALEYGLENANVRNGQMAVITSPLTKSYLKTTLKVANSTFPIYLWERNEAGQFPTIAGVMPGIVNEYPAYATKQISTNVVAQGVFSNLFKARWAGLDVVVDPYTGAAAATIRLVTNQWMDLGLRYPQSFNVSTDAPTAPA